MLPALALAALLPLLLLPLAAAQAVTLIAGSPLGASGAADGVGTAARFSTPTGLALLPSGSLIVSDYDNGRLRSVNLTDAAVRTFLGPLASSRPTGLALAPAGGILYMADALCHNILRINITRAPTWVILAGSAAQTQGFVNGLGTAAKFNAPQGLATDAAGTLFVADAENSVIRSVSAAGLVAVFAGSGAAGSSDGAALAASFWKPSAIAIDSAGNKYVADTRNYLLRRIDAATGAVTTLAGQAVRGLTDGLGTAAAFFNPRGATLGDDGRLIISDTSNNALRELNLATLAVTTLVGNGSAGAVNGVGTAARLRAPIGSAVVGGDLYLADSGGHTLRRVAGLGLAPPSPSATPSRGASPALPTSPPATATSSAAATGSPTAASSATPSASAGAAAAATTPPPTSPAGSTSSSSAATTSGAASAPPTRSATPSAPASASRSSASAPSATRSAAGAVQSADASPTPGGSGAATAAASPSASSPALSAVTPSPSPDTSASAAPSSAPAAQSATPRVALLALLLLLLLLPVCIAAAVVALRWRQPCRRKARLASSSPASPVIVFTPGAVGAAAQSAAASSRAGGSGPAPTTASAALTAARTTRTSMTPRAHASPLIVLSSSEGRGLLYPPPA